MISKPFIIAMVTTLGILGAVSLLAYWFLVHAYQHPQYQDELLSFIKQFISAFWIVLFIPLFAVEYKIETVLSEKE